MVYIKCRGLEVNCNSVFFFLRLITFFFLSGIWIKRMTFKHQNINVYLVPSDSFQHRQSFRMTACNLGVRMSWVL